MEDNNNKTSNSLTDEKFTLITQNLKEVIGANELKLLLENKNNNNDNTTRNIKAYWGTAPTGRIHIGYLLSLVKIIDLINADVQVIILIADIHALLDDKKFSAKQLDARALYYINTIQVALMSLSSNPDILDKITFVKGSSFQLQPEYNMDSLRLASITSLRMSIHSGSEVTKSSSDPILSSLLYPGLQALDEVYLGTHIQLGGYDQRKIFTFAREYLPKLGNIIPKSEKGTRYYGKRIYLMTNMLDKLRTKENKIEEKIDDNNNNEKDNSVDNKMSASDETGKIDLLDTANAIKSKINKVYCAEKDINDNSLLPIVEHIILPILKRKGIDFIIPRPDKFGGPIIVVDYFDLVNKFSNNEIYPVDLKIGVSHNLNVIIQPIRDNVDINLVKAAYK
jgi:tyrosyl-tRNA synthetase